MTTMIRKLDDSDESSFYEEWASGLFDVLGRPIQKLVIGTRVYLGKENSLWIVRNGFSIENHARQIRKIEYNTDLKRWIATN